MKNFYFVKVIMLLSTSLSLSAQCADLPSLIAEAVSTHPSIISKNSLRKSADLDVETARWQYFPTPSVSVDYAPVSSGASTSGDPVTVLNLEQPLWSGGFIDAGVESAEALSSLSAAEVELTSEQLALRVVQMYSDGYAAEMKLRAVSRSEKYHLLLLVQIERRIKEGVSPAVDLSLAKNRLEQVLAEKSMYKLQKADALSGLGQIVGHTIATDIYDSAADVFPIDTSAFENLKFQALEISSNLRRAQLNADVARAREKQVKASTSPRLTLRLEHQIGSEFDSGGGSISRAVLTVRSDFGPGFSAFSSSESAQERTFSADEEIEVIRRSIIEQLDSDRLMLISLNSRKKTFLSAIDAYSTVKSSYKRQYLEGNKSWLDLMNSEREDLQLFTQLSDVIASRVAMSWRIGVLAQGVHAVKIHF